MQVPLGRGHLSILSVMSGRSPLHHRFTQPELSFLRCPKLIIKPCFFIVTKLAEKAQCEALMQVHRN